MLKEIKGINTTNMLLFALLALMAVFIFSIFSSFITLQTAHPLENFKGKLQAVDLSHGRHATAVGTYDRKVACSLLDFQLTLKNTYNKDMYVLTKDHLIKAPPAFLDPGKNIPLTFTVKLPTTITTGQYVPTFHGDYICKNGIFQQWKHQTVIVPAFWVHDTDQKN